MSRERGFEFDDSVLGEAEFDDPPVEKVVDKQEMTYIASRPSVLQLYKHHSKSMKGVNLVTGEGADEYLALLEKCTPRLDPEKKRWIDIPSTIVLVCATASFSVPKEARACFYVKTDTASNAAQFFDRVMRTVQKKGQFGQPSNRVGVTVPLHKEGKSPGVVCLNPSACSAHMKDAMHKAVHNPDQYKLTAEKGRHFIGTEDVSRMCMEAFKVLDREGKYAEYTLPKSEWKDVPILVGVAVNTMIRYAEKDGGGFEFRPWLVTQWMVVDPFGQGLSSSAFAPIDMSFMDRPPEEREGSVVVVPEHSADSAFENLEEQPPQKRKNQSVVNRREKYAKLNDSVRAIPPENE